MCATTQVAGTSVCVPINAKSVQNSVSQLYKIGGADLRLEAVTMAPQVLLYVKQHALLLRKIVKSKHQSCKPH